MKQRLGLLCGFYIPVVGEDGAEDGAEVGGHGVVGHVGQVGGNGVVGHKLQVLGQRLWHFFLELHFW